MIPTDNELYVDDFINEHKHILETNSKPKQYDFNEAKTLSKSAKLNEQKPLVQKYWLGRLAYELAIRNDHYKTVQSSSMNELEKIVALDEYGFTAMPELNILETEHTSYPAYLISEEYGKININTIFRMYKLFDILDGAKKSKYQMNDSNFKQWQNIGEQYTSELTYLELIKLY